MNATALQVYRTGTILPPDSRRVLVRPFLIDNRERAKNLLERILQMDEWEVYSKVREVVSEFSDRHFDIQKVLLRHAEQVLEKFKASPYLSKERRLLIGAYFTSEYALESAALFNPSIVPAPDQGSLGEGELRFIMSLRATGEGHISSIEFRQGIVDAHGSVRIDRPRRMITEPEKIGDASYAKSLFIRKLAELGLYDDWCRNVMEPLEDSFTAGELRDALSTTGGDGAEQRIREGVMMLAESNYETVFNSSQAVSERIIFPSSPSERNGIEDARFVAFRDDDGELIYYATYTAYDGRVILPQLIETHDFLHFRIRTLNGPAAQNKGMALFPRKINGLYAMISRQDNENVFIMFSEHVHFWYEMVPLFRPQQPWELVQMGNCGSPIETEAGWLVLTHGVGPMRKYCIGAILLDLKDPLKVIGRLKEPLLKPDENEREGYVPNVVYTCGALIHAGKLILPYAMSDYATGIGTVDLDELLDHLQ
jgi:predicted GH43/DUF377 family glycosyl hydrolase